MKEIKNWIRKSKLPVKWLNPFTLRVNNENFLFLKDRKEMFDYDFNLNLEECEIDLLSQFEFDYYLFQFGDKFYYSGVHEETTQLNEFRYLGKSDENNLVPFLGIHGSYELCSGSRDYKDWIKKASFLNIDCLGLCEKNTLAGVVIFQKECVKNNIKPIIGETVIVRKKNNETYELKLYVKNKKGWNNLLHINKEINVTFSDLQIVDEEFLLKRTEGLICVISPNTILTKEFVKLLKIHFKALYYQFDPTTYISLDADKKRLQRLRKYVTDYMDELPSIIMSDAFYLEQEDSKIKKKLNRIGKVSSDFSSNNQYFKSFTETLSQASKLFEEKDERFEKLVVSSIETSNKIKDECNFTVELGKFHLPKYEMTDEEKSKFASSEELFIDLIKEGVEKKISKDRREITFERIKTEIKVIKEGGFVDYFLILWDIIEWCKRKGVMVGPGRGSSGGSMVAYLLNITRIDPLKYELFFERFLNKGRIGKVIEEEILTIYTKNGKKELVINDEIDKWHKSNSKLELHEYLGISLEQYKKYVL